MKIKCYRFECSQCGELASIQAFLRKDGSVGYARARHKNAQGFFYHPIPKEYATEKLRELNQLNESIDHGQAQSIKIIDPKNLESSSKLTVAGGEGFEPSTPNLGVGAIHGFSIDQFKDFLYGKYCKSYASQILNFVSKNGKDFLENPAKLLSVKSSVRSNALKSMVCLSKYLGCYEEYKVKLKSYGIKWTNEDTAFNGFLSIFSKNHDTIGPWIKQIMPFLPENEKLYLRFLATTGLRKNEAITSFNMIIELNSRGILHEYFNSELSVLEHFKYKVFLRGTKNCYISFVPKAMIEEIRNSQPVANYAIHSRLDRKGIKMRFKELRSYHNSYLRKQGIISELVDVLAGRVPKSVFARHYLGEDMKTFSSQVLFIERDLEKTLIF